MKIQIISDLHLEFVETNTQVFSESCVIGDVLVIAGDIHINSEKILNFLRKINKIPIIFVLGNHEYYGKDLLIAQENYRKTLFLPEENIFLLEKESIVLPKFEDYEFWGATFWTKNSDPVIDAFSFKIESFSFSTFFEHKRSVKSLKKFLSKPSNTKKIIITHHAPSKKSISEKYKNHEINKWYVSNLDRTIKKYQPLVWIHGHTHTSFNYFIDNTQIVCNPYGYFMFEENSNFNPFLVLDV